MKKYEVSKSLAFKLAKSLLGHVSFIENDYLGYLFQSGLVQILVHKELYSYDEKVHSYFGNGTGSPYKEPCIQVDWYIPGLSSNQFTYYQYDNFEPIYYDWNLND